MCCRVTSRGHVFACCPSPRCIAPSACGAYFYNCNYVRIPTRRASGIYQWTVSALCKVSAQLHTGMLACWAVSFPDFSLYKSQYCVGCISQECLLHSYGEETSKYCCGMSHRWCSHFRPHWYDSTFRVLADIDFTCNEEPYVKKARCFNWEIGRVSLFSK